MDLTVEDFLARFDAAMAADVAPGEGGAVDEERVARALADAAGELEGYVDRLPEAHRPRTATLRVHQLKVATYLLTLNRPGKEFEQIRNAYTDTIAFYTQALAAAAAGGGGPPIAVTTNGPTPIFTDSSLKGFT